MTIPRRSRSSSSRFWHNWHGGLQSSVMTCAITTGTFTCDEVLLKCLLSKFLFQKRQRCTSLSLGSVVG